ncbi:integrase [Citrobacter freundii]|jgi:integrase|uniref:Tyrosine-type recombinase/integrase n=1 Tax=Citrobacter freundii TaxID=546 RepID=A0A9P3Z5X1_CITFR|nr:tyrosine-type recombinase/integrase [Citrobacter freundii]HCB1813175.1 tyrosine-type recombinase/integrase [Citrobacter braakii]ATX96853.1 integrase [Citrobacter freundii]KJC07003.1 integrase [Citrobacter freundii]NTX98084.1 tyrosine-type recombinase/integrase [Citrobacter freundii]HAT7538926.1 tyrosine-type recombinase/integrase [Citrobacter freundii]
MTISKLEDGRYMVDLRPQGRKGVRLRRRFATRAEALRFERWAVSNYNNKEWMVDDKKDTRTLEELIAAWWKYHGQSLKSGEIMRIELDRICYELSNPRAGDINKKMFTEYRANRLLAGISPTTINREHALLSGVFTALIKAGQYSQSNPLSNLPRVKTTENEKIFLTSSQIEQLLLALDGDNLRLAKFALSTGARWDEAAQIQRSRVLKYKAVFTDTKNGKNRTVPISASLHDEITKNRKSGSIFPDADYFAFRDILKGLFDLPAGQATHVMRHTFASHFMMNGGNILTLQKILGHASINQTMAYAHLAPDYLQDAITLNPVSMRGQK